MDAYNQTLIEACRDGGVELYDIAAAVPKDTTIFYDECHLTERGARVFARLLVDWLADRPPFAAPMN
jgi:hypothetical protein